MSAKKKKLHHQDCCCVAIMKFGLGFGHLEQGLKALAERTPRAARISRKRTMAAAGTHKEAPSPLRGSVKDSESDGEAVTAEPSIKTSISSAASSSSGEDLDDIEVPQPDTLVRRLTLNILGSKGYVGVLGHRTSHSHDDHAHDHAHHSHPHHQDASPRSSRSRDPRKTMEGLGEASMHDRDASLPSSSSPKASVSSQPRNHLDSGGLDMVAEASEEAVLALASAAKVPSGVASSLK